MPDSVNRKKPAALEPIEDVVVASEPSVSRSDLVSLDLDTEGRAGQALAEPIMD